MECGGHADAGAYMPGGDAAQNLSASGGCAPFSANGGVRVEDVIVGVVDGCVLEIAELENVILVFWLRPAIIFEKESGAIYFHSVEIDLECGL